MTRQQKILIAAGGLIVALYVGALGNQGRSGEGDASSPGGFVEWLGGLAGGSAEVDPADLTTDCPAVDRASSPAPGPSATPTPPATPPATPTPSAASAAAPAGAATLAVDGSCTLRVAARDGGVRRVTVRPQHPVKVIARAPRGDETVTDDVAAGEKSQVAIDEKGADITLRCGRSQPCTVTLGGED